MMGPTPFRDILLVAGFELREMLRSRRALVLTALYLLGGLGFAYWFVNVVIAALESAAAQALGARAAATPGALTQQLLQDETYRRVIRGFFDNPDVADYLMGLPPIVLAYAWSSFQFVPLLIMITASDTVAQELQSRGVRFVALRTGRLEFIAGKMLGQASLMGLVTLLTALMFLGVAAEGLKGFEWLPAISAVLQFWPRILVYGFAFVGLSILCSANAGSTNMARAFSLLGLFATSAVSVAAELFENRDSGPVWEALAFLAPNTHKTDLWSPALDALLPACLILAALGVLYLGVGVLFARRRDL